jgi:hypothetical protein
MDMSEKHRLMARNQTEIAPDGPCRLRAGDDKCRLPTNFSVALPHVGVPAPWIARHER